MSSNKEKIPDIVEVAERISKKAKPLNMSLREMRELPIIERWNRLQRQLKLKKYLIK